MYDRPAYRATLILLLLHDVQRGSDMPQDTRQAQAHCREPRGAAEKSSLSLGVLKDPCIGRPAELVVKS